MKPFRILGPFALAASLAGLAHAGEWTVNESASSVGFTAEQQGSKFNGRFEEFSAMIDFDPSAPAEGKIVGTVVTDSVNTRDYDRDAALTDRDWFNSAEYPEATFQSDSISKTDAGYAATGQLTIKGTTKPATLNFTFDANGAAAKFSGRMNVDRFEFNVGEGWNDTSWVSQNVEVLVELDLAQ